MRLTALFAALLLASLSTHAQVYKCREDGTGKVTYSDDPCHGKNSGHYLDLKENTLDTSGSREQAMRAQMRDMQGQIDRLERRGTSQPAIGRTQADLQGERADSLACERARRSLEIEAGSMTRNKATVESKEAAMRSACGLREPDKVEINNTYSRRDLRGPASRPRSITSCDAGGCWDSDGGRYNRSGGDTYFPASGGGACQMVHGRMQCP